MADPLVAHAWITINAPRARVWEALVNPEMIAQYLPVTSVTSDWGEGSPIVWKSEFQGKAFEVKGTVLPVEPERGARVRPFSTDFPTVRRQSATGQTRS